MITAHIQGNAGGNGEIKGDYATCRIAVHNGKKDGEKLTEWVSIRAKSGTWAGDAIAKIVKGEAVHVSGRLSLDRYTGKNGEERSTLSVWADQCASYPRKPRGDTSVNGNAQRESFDDDIPF